MEVKMWPTQRTDKIGRSQHLFICLFISSILRTKSTFQQWNTWAVVKMLDYHSTYRSNQQSYFTLFRPCKLGCNIVNGQIAKLSGCVLHAGAGNLLRERWIYSGAHCKRKRNNRTIKLFSRFYMAKSIFALYDRSSCGQIQKSGRYIRIHKRILMATDCLIPGKMQAKSATQSSAYEIKRKSKQMSLLGIRTVLNKAWVAFITNE